MNRPTGGEESALVLATQIGMAIVSIAIQGVLAWLLAPEGRGSYAVCFLFGVTFGVFFYAGIDRAAQYYTSSKKINIRQGLSSALLIGGIASVVSILIGLILIKSNLEYFSKARTEDFYTTLFLIPLSTIYSIVHMQLSGLGRFGFLAKLFLSQSILTLLGIVVLVYLLQYGVQGALVSDAIAFSIATTIGMYELTRVHGYKPEIPKKENLTILLNYGFRYYFARIGQIVDVRLGVFILALLATEHEIGLYAAAIGIVLKVLMLSSSLEITLQPRIYSSQTGRAELVNQGIRFITLLTLFAVLTLCLFSETIIRYLLSEDFIQSSLLMWVMAPGVVFFAGSKMIVVFLRGTDRPGVSSIAVWLGYFFNILVTFWLYPTTGLVAAAWGLTAGNLVSALFLLIIYIRITGCSVVTIFKYSTEDYVALKTLSTQLLHRFRLVSAK
jgi:O-antigen/teichoic acid export membrane protein